MSFTLQCIFNNVKTCSGNLTIKFIFIYKRGNYSTAKHKPFLRILYTNCVQGRHYGLVTSVHPSVRMFKFENYWTDRNEVWYGCCINGHCLQIVLLDIVRSVLTKLRRRKAVRWDGQ